MPAKRHLLVLPLLLLLLLVLLLLVVVLSLRPTGSATNHYQFTPADKAFLSMFYLGNLPAPPAAPANRHADNPAAAALGQTLFFDTRLSSNGEISCASCHQPERYFTDGLARSRALGQTRRNAPSIVGTAYGPWKFWDGRADSLWAQALAPIEDPAEHGFSRLEAAQLIARHYREDYERVFGGLPEAAALDRHESPATPAGNDIAAQNWDRISSVDKKTINRVFSNIGKAIMAYERRLPIPPSRFDHFLAALTNANSSVATLEKLFTPDEVRGLRLFVGKAGCASCHNGPLFTNFEFHNVGAPEPDQTNVDLGRFSGIDLLQSNEFTCLSSWSDAAPGECGEMRFLKKTGPELVGAFKTPSLRNVAATAPYMQSGQLATLEEVVEHYNNPTPPYYDRAQHPSRPHFDVLPLRLTDAEKTQLIAFLKTLTSPIPENDKWWRAPG